MKSGIAFVLVGIVASACDDGVFTAIASCREYCNKLEVCDDATDLSGCLQRCDDQRVRSPSYLSMRAKCTNKLSCNLWQGEVGLMGEDICASGDQCQLNECIADELYSRPATNDEKGYCSSVANKLHACDRTLEMNRLDMHCLDLVGTLSTEYLREMMGCVESDCAQLVRCLKRTADRYDTDLSVYPGSLAAAL